MMKVYAQPRTSRTVTNVGGGTIGVRGSNANTALGARRRDNALAAFGQLAGRGPGAANPRVRG